MLELWYFTWVFLVIRPFCEYYYFWPCDLDLGVWPIFLKTLTLLKTFEQWVLELWYFTWVSVVIRPFCGSIIFDLVTLTLEFDLLFKNLDLANNFWIVSARALIFHMSIPYDKTFAWFPLFHYLVTLTREFDLLFKNLDLAYNFWTVSARALIVHMSIPCD